MDITFKENDQTTGAAVGTAGNPQAQAAFDPDSRYPGAGGENPTPSKPHPLDTEESLKQFHKLYEWYELERERQSINRYQQAIDHDFYDGLQYAEDDIQELESRSQAPLTYNLIAESVNWLTGTEKRTKIDFKVFPRSEQGCEDANTKTKVLKYVSDVNKTAFNRSLAFEDAMKVGVGWLEDGIRGDPTQDPMYSRYESWRNMLYDSSGVERDLSDARYIFRWKWLDLDIALGLAPDREHLIRAAAVAADMWGNDQDEEFWFLGQRFQAKDALGNVIGRRTYISDTNLVNNRRERVKIVEVWYRLPEVTKTLWTDDDNLEHLNGQIFDEANKAHAQAIQDGAVTVYNRLMMRMYCALFVTGGLLQNIPSPYRHNQFPFTPIWAYRRGRDNAPYGVIRNQRDPQEDLNKRMSKAQFILSTNQIIAEKGAIDTEVQDWNEVREEASRPDGIINSLKNAQSKFEIRRDVELAQSHLNLMDRDAAFITRVSGQTPENQGRVSSNVIGDAAIERLQRQGTVSTATLFDNLRYAIQIQGEKQLSLVEQYYSEPKVIRLTASRGQVDWLTLNQPEQQPDGSVRFINDITKTQADFVVDEQDYSETVRRALFENMMEMLMKMPPQIALNLLDLVIEYSDLPGYEDMVQRIRKLNGQPAPGKEMTPEEQAALHEQAQEVQQMKALQVRGILAKIMKDEAAAGYTNSQRTEKLVDAVFAAMQAAGLVVASPGVTVPADVILAEAGWRNQAGDNPNIPTAPPGTQPVAATGNNPTPFPAHATVGAEAGINGGKLQP
ncbi:MAG: portal protein [Sulfuricaulis sp.]